MLKELDLHITNRCTLSCSYCCFSSGRLHLPELTLDIILGVLNEAKAMGCEHLHITGGEPLLRKDIFKIIRYASDLGLSVRLQTNGSMLSVDLLEKLSYAGLKSLMISLDSWNQETHDLLRGTDSHKKAVQAIKSAVAFPFNIRVNSVITKINYNEIYETIKYVKNMGIKSYSAFYFSPLGCGRQLKEHWIPPEEYYNYFSKLNEKIHNTVELNQMNIVIEKGYAGWEEAKEINISSFTGCGGGCMNTYSNRDYLILRCDGNVYPCIMAIDRNPLGNIHEKPLKEIRAQSAEWESLKLVGDEECSKCEHNSVCGEGCRYYPIYVNGEKYTHDMRCIKEVLVPLCPIMKYNLVNHKLGGSSDDVMVEK